MQENQYFPVSFLLDQFIENNCLYICETGIYAYIFVLHSY